MTGLLLAERVSVIARDGEVFVEFRDDTNAVFAVAGLKICAAVDFSSQVTAACERALVGKTSSGAIH